MPAVNRMQEPTNAINSLDKKNPGMRSTASGNTHGAHLYCGKWTVLISIIIPLSVASVATAQSEEEDTRRSVETRKKIELLQKRGEFLTKNKKYEQAFTTLQQILPLLDLPDETLLYNLGTLAMDGMSDCNTAILYYQGYLYAAPNDKGTPEVRRRLARCLKSVREGTFTLESKPEAVEVRVNNVTLGRAPVRSVQLGPGQYVLRIERVDFLDYERDITIQSNVETRESVRLTKVLYKGSVTVKTNPTGAKVWINDTFTGTAPLTQKDLDTKKYLIRIEKDGWDRWIRYVEVLRDANVTVDAKLENTGVQVPIPPLPRND
jgi:hypothetical protein